VGSIWDLDLAIKDPAADLQRARGIVDSLSKAQPIRDIDGAAWKVEYVDFEDRAAALEALRYDLDSIDLDWTACLTCG
jgi:hypothetical protein